MNHYQDYFTQEKIINVIANLRANEGYKRHKLHFLSEFEAPTNILNKIYSYTPPRRLWINLGKNERKNLSPTQANVIRIIRTISKYSNSTDSWNLNLKNLLSKVQEKVQHSTIKSPKIAFLPKDNIYFRPLTIYTLDDHIFIGLLAKYLTDFYDPIFSNHALAFRSKQFQKQTGIKTYHQVIDNIANYRKKYKKLYVAECDIKAFYDSVPHYKIKELVEESNIHGLAKSTIQDYLYSYDFNMVLAESIKNRKKVKTPNLDTDKRGIPQGGAISCWLSNLTLNKADLLVKERMTDHDLYYRYCDDIIMISPNKKRLKIMFNTYIKALKELKLDYHKPVTVPYSDVWYDVKTKAPYEWSKEHYPWINFLGYQIHYSGNLRIRKRSIEKEKLQQKEFIDTIINKIEGLSPQKKRLFIKLNSKWFKRVVGLSFSDFNKKKSFAWSGGFKMLSTHDFETLQIKQLDQHWHNQLIRLKEKVRIKKVNNKYHKFEYLGSYYNAFEHGD